MELTRENIVDQIKKQVIAKNRIVSITLTNEDYTTIKAMSSENRELDILFGYPVVSNKLNHTGVSIDTSTINVALHDS